MSADGTLELCLVGAHFPASFAAEFMPMQCKWKCCLRLLEGSLKGKGVGPFFHLPFFFWNSGVMAGALATIMAHIRRGAVPGDDWKLVW